MKVQDIDISKIIIEDRARVDLGNIDELSNSLKEKGLLQPISIDTNFRLLAGGRRIAAAKAAGFATISAVIRPAADNLDQLEVELYENVHRKDMTWPERAKLEKRIELIKTAQDPEWSQRKQAHLLDVSVGAVNRRLQLAEYLDAVPELGGLKTEEEAWKAVKKIEEGFMIDALARKRENETNGKPDKEKGYAKWANDHYKVGDAFAGMQKVQDGTAHFAEVDPPYAIGLDRRKARSKTDNKMSNYDEVAPEEYTKFIRAAATELHRILDRNAFAIWWFGIEWYQEVLAELTEVGFKVNPIPAIWYKGNSGQTASPDTMLGSSYETFFVLRKGEPKLAKAGRSNTFVFAPLPPNRKIHPTEKPVELMVEILETFLYPGSRVLCPFLGSGVTLRACYRTNHVGYGWDKSIEHKKKFLMRVDEDCLLGVKPKLVKAVGE